MEGCTEVRGPEGVSSSWHQALDAPQKATWEAGLPEGASRSQHLAAERARGLVRWAGQPGGSPRRGEGWLVSAVASAVGAAGAVEALDRGVLPATRGSSCLPRLCSGGFPEQRALAWNAKNGCWGLNPGEARGGGFPTPRKGRENLYLSGESRTSCHPGHDAC